jgi:hypothetical protein
MKRFAAIMKQLAPLTAALFLLIVSGSAIAQRRDRVPDFPVYDTKYYRIYTDLNPELVRETSIRMTKMAEEYQARTRDFSGAIRQRLPFYLYKDAKQYHAYGGSRGSAGYFDGTKLVAIAGEVPSVNTWQTVQHEGFHQYCHAVIGGDIPTWVNEGLAEYFGESIFTGDGFVSGVVPNDRADRVKKMIAAGKARSVEEMMNVTLDQWNANMSAYNYDQAWSMVHFLAHGENGKYQKAFAGFMMAVGHGSSWQKAWAEHFGSSEGFEEKWKRYWTELPRNATRDLYAEAILARFNAFYARAMTQKQSFETFEGFIEAVKEKKLLAHEGDWLPPGLVEELLEVYPRAGTWSLETMPNKTAAIVLTLKSGRRLIGNSTSLNNRIQKVWIETDDMGIAIADAKAKLKDGAEEDARTILKEALRANPKSNLFEQARSMLSEIKN